MTVCGSYNVTGLAEEEVAATKQGFLDIDPPPINVSAAGKPDGTWTVTATFPPCPGNVSHATDTPAASAPAAVPEQSTRALAQRILSFFLAHAWSRSQSIGIIANIEAESSFNPVLPGDGGAAYGLCQWHADRQAAFQRVYGHPMHGSTFSEQLSFVDYELRLGSERSAGQRLLQATTPEQAARLVSQYYERPADVEGSKATRAALATKWSAALGPA